MGSISSSTVSELAELFGVTTNQIVENTSRFLSKYGWYMAIKHIFIIPVVAGIITIIVALLFPIIADIFSLDESKYKGSTVVSVVFIVITAILLICEFVPLLIAPELVGLEYLK